MCYLHLSSKNFSLHYSVCKGNQIKNLNIVCLANWKCFRMGRWILHMQQNHSVWWETQSFTVWTERNVGFKEIRHHEVIFTVRRVVHCSSEFCFLSPCHSVRALVKQQRVATAFWRTHTHIQDGECGVDYWHAPSLEGIFLNLFEGKKNKSLPSW